MTRLVRDAAIAGQQTGGDTGVPLALGLLLE